MNKQKNKKKILILGNKSFLQKSLYLFFKKKKINVQKITFQKFHNYQIPENCIIINCSISKEFFKQKYQEKIDRNFKIAKKIKNIKAILIMISTRQVYKPKLNLNEKTKVRPINTYGRNMIISEKKCKKIVSKKLMIIRTSNVIGFEQRRLRQSMMSLLLSGFKNRKILMDSNSHYYKDILPVNLFCNYIYKLISKNFIGTINVGSGIKLRLLDIYHLIEEKINFKPKLILYKKNDNNDNSYSYNIQKLKKITNLKINSEKLKCEIHQIAKQLKKKK